MCITREEILELNCVIQKINSFSSGEERDKYLLDSVEDVELFISTLRAVNKNKLVSSQKRKEHISKHNAYTCEAVMEIFEKNDLEVIVSRYSKQELTDMYLTFYSTKPVSSYDKTRIAQNIYHYIYKMNRTKALCVVN